MRFLHFDHALHHIHRFSAGGFRFFLIPGFFVQEPDPALSRDIGDRQLFRLTQLYLRAIQIFVVDIQLRERQPGFYAIAGFESFLISGDSLILFLQKRVDRSAGKGDCPHGIGFRFYLRQFREGCFQFLVTGLFVAAFGGFILNLRGADDRVRDFRLDIDHLGIDQRLRFLLSDPVNVLVDIFLLLFVEVFGKVFAGTLIFQLNDMVTKLGLDQVLVHFSHTCFQGGVRKFWHILPGRRPVVKSALRLRTGVIGELRGKRCQLGGRRFDIGEKLFGFSLRVRIRKSALSRLDQNMAHLNLVV